MDGEINSKTSGGIADTRQHIKIICGKYFKKSKYKPHQVKMWCIPPEQNAEFVARMEDILWTYSLPYNPQRPLVCIDEKPYQLLDDSLQPLEMSEINHIKKQDCEYERKGTCSIFMFTEPLSGWREAHALPQRRSEDWAYQIKWLIDEVYPTAEKIVLVMDNLNTHKISSFYKCFPANEAFRLSQKLEIHYTPKHGSWLNIAEIELSVMTSQCLGKRRIPSRDILNKELSHWAASRNSLQKGVDWHFNIDESRVSLKHLYPTVLL